MNGFNRITDMYLSHYNKLFWLLFAIAGGIFIASVLLGILSMMYLDLVLGIVLVAAGIHRTGDEFFNRSIKSAHEDSVRTINELLQWAEKSYDYTRDFKDRHERRFHRLDRKRAEHENKTEDLFRDAVKKIIQIENRVNKALKTIEQPHREISMPPRADPVPARTGEPAVTRSSIQPRLKDLSPTQTRAIQYLRKAGRITNREYRKGFRVSEKRAYNELVSMYQMGLLKREGRGRSTHYVLAF